MGGLLFEEYKRNYLVLGIACTIAVGSSYFTIEEFYRRLKPEESITSDSKVTPSAPVVGNRCFDEKDGTPQKWYAVRWNSTVTLYDGPGFDPETGAARILVVPAICRIFDLQQHSRWP